MLAAKNIKGYFSYKPYSFTVFERDLPSPEKIFDGPANFTWCQLPHKMNAITLYKKFSLHNLQLISTIQ